MKVFISGYGRMGKMVESVLKNREYRVFGRVGRYNVC